ncbi:MAG: hypothetical protein QOK44_2418 [Betaproteobacteria bacterium]|jgi:hypothetical protein|nr:hypothetical protein [Betaproteobacteria bacterium]
MPRSINIPVHTSTVSLCDAQCERKKPFVLRSSKHERQHHHFAGVHSRSRKARSGSNRRREGISQEEAK